MILWTPGININIVETAYGDLEVQVYNSVSVSIEKQGQLPLDYTR